MKKKILILAAVIFGFGGLQTANAQLHVEYHNKAVVENDKGLEKAKKRLDSDADATYRHFKTALEYALIAVDYSPNYDNLLMVGICYHNLDVNKL